MRALHSTAADIQGRAHNLIYAQRLGRYGCAHNIHHRIDRPDLMEMNALQIAVVNLGLNRSQALKNGDSCFLRRRADLRPRNYLPDLPQAPALALRMRLMPVWSGHSCR